MTAPTPDSAPLLEPLPPPVLAPPTTAFPPPPPRELPGRAQDLPPIGDMLVMVGGLMVVGFSFAPFVSYATASTRFQGATVNRSAWEWAPFLAPLTWFVVLGGLLLLALGLSHLLSGDRRLLGFRTGQLQIVVAAYVASILVGYALADKSLQVSIAFLETQVAVTNGEFAWGGVLMLVGSLLGVVGAVITLAKPQDRARPQNS